jgi:hypothetical protein
MLNCSTYTAKTQYRKFETNIPRKGIARPLSQFPHSCVCERFLYSHDRSVYSVAGKYVDRSWEYINRSQTHECGIGTEAVQFSFCEYIKGIFVAVYTCTKHDLLIHIFLSLGVVMIRCDIVKGKPAQQVRLCISVFYLLHLYFISLTLT